MVARNSNVYNASADDIAGTVDNATNSFFGATVTITVDTSSINNGGDPGLGGELFLLGNGGPPSLRVLDGSPLINGGRNSSRAPDILDIDHDGNTTEPIPLDGVFKPRVVAGKVDIGAVEYKPSEKIGGTDGDDSIDGGLGKDSISGNGGDDTIDGGAGNDRASGGAGGDKILGRGGNDILAGNGGPDFLNGGGGNDRANGGGGNDTVNGGTGKDHVNGGGGADQLAGGGGDDSVNGNGGNDLISGNAGADLLTGGVGRDSLFGGNGDDVLRGGAGSDDVNGGGGRDTVDGGKGDDVLTGGLNADVFVFGDGEDSINDLHHNDKIDLSLSNILDREDLFNNHIADSPVLGYATIVDGANSCVIMGYVTADLTDLGVFVFAPEPL